MPAFRCRLLLCLALACFVLAGCSTSETGSTASTTTAVTATSADSGPRDGSAAHPLEIVLLPAEGQSAGGVLGGMKPVFDAITQSTGLHFEAKAADSYASAVQALVTRHADIANLGPYTYVQARQQGAAELLAVSVRNGQSTYNGGIFTRADSGIKKIADLKGKSVAFGDLNSTSSFNYQCAMMLRAGINPSRDLGKVYITGSHAAALAALGAGKVDACCCGTFAFNAGVKGGQIDPAKFVMIAETDPIPGSPWCMHPKLPAKVKQALKAAFRDLKNNPNLGPNGIRGEDGKPLDKFDTTITDAVYDKALAFLDPVTDELKAAILAKAEKS